MRTNQRRTLSTAKKKQLVVALIAAGAFAGVVSLSYLMINKQKQDNAAKQVEEAKNEVVTTDFTHPQATISENALWASNEGAKVAALERTVADLTQKLEQSNIRNPTDSGLNGPDGLGVPGAGSIPDSGQALPVKPARTIVNFNVDEEAAPLGSGTQAGDGGSAQEPQVRLAKYFKNSEQWARVQGHRMNIEVTEDGGEIMRSAVTRGRFRARDSYIPSGTFFRSVLLGGVDAPTGGEAQSASPHPVLMRVTDFAQLPNRFKYNFRECFITGQAYGDISAERAYIRLQNLSCVGTDGRAIDMPVRGYVAGEDGKTGVRGQVVTKQGQILANALLAGVLGGLGRGISESFKVTNDTAFGTTTSVSGGNQYKAGVADGVGNAADRLAQYYIKLADKVFPVIEVNAGRTVDVVLTQGIEIDTGATK